MSEKCPHYFEKYHDMHSKVLRRGGKPVRKLVKWCTHPENVEYRSKLTDGPIRGKQPTCAGDRGKCHFPGVWKDKKD